MIRRPAGKSYPSNVSHFDEDVPIVGAFVCSTHLFCSSVWPSPVRTIGLFLCYHPTWRIRTLIPLSQDADLERIFNNLRVGQLA